MFIFTLVVAQKNYESRKDFTKPLEEPQRSVKIKI